MFRNKKYIIIALVVTLGTGIFTWFFFDGKLPHRSPIRAKQVFYQIVTNRVLM
ncbi:hypothetical protein UFO1_1976 [Pelosinus sp. UFO1]|nr:hypothetical protein UFO1_1976 [Pelosinus sp. UFO1]